MIKEPAFNPTNSPIVQPIQMHAQKQIEKKTNTEVKKGEQC